MPAPHQASILAVGTELTTGQITNRNAAWLSEKLVALGAEVILHETVADERAMIRSALDRCRSLSSLIFVTGGLGPTTDDFTREVISEWAQKPLEWNDPAWRKIEERLTRAGLPVAQSNRQQCFFPKGAEVIPNDQGTAEAFGMKIDAASDAPAWLWALPGPPREIEAVWNAGLERKLIELLPRREKLNLRTWQCIGKSEAELGELTERALEGSGLQTGYRAHRPYVEIKVWATDEQLRTKSAHLEALEQAIGPWVATRQGEDLAGLLLKELGRSSEVEILDSLTGGILADRIGALLRGHDHEDQAAAFTLATEWVSPASPREWVEGVLGAADPEVITLAIVGFTETGEWALGLREGDTLKVETRQSPLKTRQLLDRSRRYATEYALKRWREWLREAMQLSPISASAWPSPRPWKPKPASRSL